MKSINTKQEKAVKKGHLSMAQWLRAMVLSNVAVGTQSSSPLYWSIERGSQVVAKAIVTDLLTTSADQVLWLGAGPLAAWGVASPSFSVLKAGVWVLGQADCTNYIQHGRCGNLLRCQVCSITAVNAKPAYINDRKGYYMLYYCFASTFTLYLISAAPTCLLIRSTWDCARRFIMVRVLWYAATVRQCLVGLSLLCDFPGRTYCERCRLQ